MRPRPVKTLHPRPKKPRPAPPPIREDIHTPAQLMEELRRVFPAGVHKHALGERLRRALENAASDPLRDAALIGHYYYYDPGIANEPTLSAEAREVWSSSASSL